MTRPSTQKKPKSSRNPTKLSGLRRKLTLRPAVSPVLGTSNIKVEEIHVSENIGQEIHGGNNSDQGVEPVMNNVKLETDQMKKSTFFQRASPMKLVRLYPKITEEQRALIQKYDYGGLLQIKCSKLKPELCQFLMDSFDPTSCSLVFPGRGSIPLTEESVNKEQFCSKGRKQPPITFLEEKLASMRPANSKFLRFFITYGMCSVLAPTTGVRIGPRLYPSLVNIKQAKDLNMCRFVIMILCKALKGSGESEKVQPCMLYLMVKYPDSLQLQNMQISDEGTHVSVWTNAMVKEAIRQDRRSDGSFGAAPLKPEFASIGVPSETETTTSESSSQQEHISCPVPEAETEHSEELSEEHIVASPIEYEHHSTDEPKKDEPEIDEPEKDEFQNEQSILFADPQVINKFIQKNAPPDLTDEDTSRSRYRYAIEYACHGFEASLQILVKNLSAGSSAQSKVTRNTQQASVHKIKESPPKKCMKKVNSKSSIKPTSSDTNLKNEEEFNTVTQGAVKVDEPVADKTKPGNAVDENSTKLQKNEENRHAIEKSENNLVPLSRTQIAQVSTQVEVSVQECSKPDTLEAIIDSYVEAQNRNGKTKQKDSTQDHLSVPSISEQRNPVS